MGWVPWRFTKLCVRRKGSFGKATSYALSRNAVVTGAHNAKARGASSSSRDTTTISRTLAAMPKSTR